MDTPSSSGKPSKPSGLSLRTVGLALIGLVVVSLVCLGFVSYWLFSDRHKLQREVQKLQTLQTRNELDKKRGDEAGKVTLARTRQEEVLAQARNATNVLERLLQQVNRIIDDANALKTNEVGRRIALYSDLVAQARRLYEANLSELAPPADIITKLETARRIELQLVSATGTAYEPAADLAVTTQNAGLWGEQELRKAAQAQTLVAALAQESKIKVAKVPLTATSPTLAAAIDRLNQAEATAREQLMLASTAQAKTQGVTIEATAAVQQIIEESKLKAANTLVQVEEAKAQQQRTQQVRQTEIQIQNSKAKVQADQNLDEARRIELRQKASDPEIQVKLAPFLTPGYLQVKTQSYDKKPYSFTQLQGFGALDQTPAGLLKLGQIASAPRDQVRPRWKLTAGWLKRPQQLEKVKEAQQLLIDLGPVLVEMQLLEP
jgi:hypothetical protein